MAIKPCCLVPENRVLVEQRPVPQPNGFIAQAEQRRCSVCGCNHYKLSVGELQPGAVGIR